MVQDWNTCHEEAKSLVEEQNQQLIAQRERGELTATALFEGLQRAPEKVPIPTRRWCQKFRTNYGWSLLSRGGDTQAFLPYSHPDMAASRDAMAEMLADGVHEALVLNFDQVWRCAFFQAAICRWTTMRSGESTSSPGQKVALHQGVQEELDSPLAGSKPYCTIPVTNLAAEWASVYT